MRPAYPLAGGGQCALAAAAFTTFVSLSPTGATAAQPAPADVWARARFFAGEWEGAAEGQAGTGTVRRSYRFVLADRYLYETNVSTYPPQPANEAGEVHEHWSFWSHDRERKTLVLRQFHQEGLVNQFVLGAAENDAAKLVFDSERFENFDNRWKARETYEIRSTDEFVETFELAAPGKEFEVYSRTTLRRARPSASSSAGTSGAAVPEGSPPPVEIRTKNGTELEAQGRDQLTRLLATWDLSKWLFTRVVSIESRVIPHSHPVLTLNTRYLDDDAAQAATFVHEQLHWFLVDHHAATEAAIAELRQLYPQAPAGPPLGARDQESTYRHLLVNLLELDGVTELFGEHKARQILGAYQHYPWIYREVLERPAPIREVLRRHGLQSPDARQ